MCHPPRSLCKMPLQNSEAQSNGPGFAPTNSGPFVAQLKVTGVPPWGPCQVSTSPLTCSQGLWGGGRLLGKAVPQTPPHDTGGKLVGICDPTMCLLPPVPQILI